MKIQNVNKYFGLVGAFLIYSLSSIFVKYASLYNISSTKYWLFFVIAIFVLGVYAFLWQRILKEFSLFMAYSAKGLVIIFVLLWSVILFYEKISLQNIIGSIMIIAGIIVVNKDVN